MNRDSVITQQILALRSAAVTVVAQADALLFTMESETRGPASGECQHPEEKRESTATAGDAHSFFCHGCKQTSEEIEAATRVAGGGG